MSSLPPLPAYSTASIELYRAIDLLGAALAYGGRVRFYENPLPHSSYSLPHIWARIDEARQELIRLHQKTHTYSRVDERFSFPDMWPQDIYLGMAKELMAMEGCLREFRRYARRLGERGPSTRKSRCKRAATTVRGQQILLQRLVQRLVSDEQMQLPL